MGPNPSMRPKPSCRSRCCLCLGLPPLQCVLAPFPPSFPRLCRPLLPAPARCVCSPAHAETGSCTVCLDTGTRRMGRCAAAVCHESRCVEPPWQQHVYTRRILRHYGTAQIKSQPLPCVQPGPAPHPSDPVPICPLCRPHPLAAAHH